MRKEFRFGRHRIVFLAAAMLLTTTSFAYADYLISPGDVLALSVTGIDELNTKVSVDLDGKIILPLIGSVSVGELSLADATESIKRALPGKELDRHLQDGRTVPVIIAPSRISLSIAEYRPVYVNGNVAKPGEIPYRPGLTVRQAVVLAGGFDIARFKLDNPLMQLSELTGEANALWIEYARTQATVARLKAELDDKPQIERRDLEAVPVGEGVNEAVFAYEQKQLAARNTDYQKEQAYLIASSAKETERAQILDQQRKAELDGLKIDTEDLERYQELFKRGAVALPNVSVARRTVLASSTRALQTSVALATVERENRDINRKLERLGNVRRMKLLEDVVVATSALAITKARLQTASAKLRFVGAVKTQLVRGFDDQIVINVTRTKNRHSAQLTVTADTELEPGDVIDILITTADPFTAP